MVLPARYDYSIHNLHYYQSLIIAELSLTLLFYLAFKIFHYVKWGHDEEEAAQEGGEKKN